MAIGRAGPGQQWAGSKPGWAKIGPVFSGQIVFSRQKKIRAGRAGLGHTGWAIHLIILYLIYIFKTRRYFEKEKKKVGRGEPFVTSERDGWTYGLGEAW